VSFIVFDNVAKLDIAEEKQCVELAAGIFAVSSHLRLPQWGHAKPFVTARIESTDFAQ
jgi:hypothetical protein